MDESLARFAEVCTEAKKLEFRIRGYVSCVLGCPYEEYVPHSQVSKVSRIVRRSVNGNVSQSDSEQSVSLVGQAISHFSSQSTGKCVLQTVNRSIIQ